MAPRVPSLISGINVFALPLSTKEGFVLSRVDGASSVEDISIMVGLRQEELLGILERLQDLGAVHLAWSPRKAAAAKPSPTAAKASPAADAAQAPRRADSAVARALAEPEMRAYNPKELDETADISREVKKRILNAFYTLEDKNYYQLLGVTRDADKRDIRAAYFELSKLFHPDAFFGKQLGSFKPKMEVVFKRLTEAYDALGRPAKRKEYDDYLATTMQTTALRETLEQVERDAASMHAAPPPSAPPEAEPERKPLRAVMPPAGPDAKTPSSASLRPPPTPDERRALARERLRRNLRPDAQAASAQPPSDRNVNTSPLPAALGGTARERRDSAIAGLRKSIRAASAVTNGSDAVVAHIKRAKDAESAGDLFGAASSLQAALALDPERQELLEQYERVSKAVSRSLADNYEKQARYEEKMGKWQAAALSWARVADGRPEDAHASRAAAEALLKAGGDLHRAQKYAQQAADMAPKVAASFVVLARVFLAAGLRLNAKRELEKAVKLDPQDEMIKNLLNETR